MSKIDESDVDARLLRLLVAVVETGSITRAAQRLDVTQSAVSHQLDRLRAIVGDPLVVKSGRGIVPTARAGVLAAKARELLDAMNRFAQHGAFDPQRWIGTVTIAANDFQRDLLLPRLMARLRQAAPGLRLRVIPSDVPSADMLRLEHCQLVISPRPPEAGDIVQKRLFEDRYRMFYDPAQWQGVPGKTDYLSAEHITVVYEPRRHLDIDDHLERQGVRRHFAIMVPGFAGLAPFLRGSRLIATVPGMLRQQSLQGLADAPVPVPCPKMPMYMIWHLRHREDQAHAWLRHQILAAAATCGISR